jgi:hypothetical protein
VIAELIAGSQEPPLPVTRPKPQCLVPTATDDALPIGTKDYRVEISLQLYFH